MNTKEKELMAEYDLQLRKIEDYIKSRGDEAPFEQLKRFVELREMHYGYKKMISAHVPENESRKQALDALDFVIAFWIGAFVLEWSVEENQP